MKKLSGMGMSLHLIAKNKSCLSFKRLHASVLSILIILPAFAGLNYESQEIYSADDFGYIIINRQNKALDIYKYETLEKKRVINVANCIISEDNDSYLVISSIHPKTYEDIFIDTTFKREEPTDSISVKITFPDLDSDDIYGIWNQSDGGSEKVFLTSEKAFSLRLKNFDFDLDNIFSVTVYPIVKPFQNNTSWGDNETLSFFDLRLDLNLPFYEIQKDVLIPPSKQTITEVLIDLNGFTDDVFSKWVVIDDFILKENDSIIWKDLKFTKVKQDNEF